MGIALNIYIASGNLTKRMTLLRLSFCFLPFFQTRKEKVEAETATPAKEGEQPREGDISFPLYISHPVRQKKKKVYRTDQTTFIIGETPKGTRRYASLSLRFCGSVT